MNEIRYVIYARKSTESEDKQVQSIEDQVRIMQQLAKRQGLKIVDKPIIESKSAKKPFQRPEFTRMLQMIEDGKVNGILCWQLNRLSRNPTESGILQQLLQDESLLSIHTNDRIYLPEDNAIVFSVDAGMSNQFIRDLMKSVRRGMYSKAEKGWLPGTPTIGYKNDRENKIIVIDPDRWLLVRKMWDLMLTGNYTVSQITRIADKEWGLKTIPRKRIGGKALGIGGAYYMFQNPFYMGLVRYGGELHLGKHEAMVTQEEFERVQSLIKRRNTARPSIEQEVDPFPYRGLINCGECGCLITYTKKTKKYKNGNSQDFEYSYCTRKRKDYECSQRTTIKPSEITKKVRDELKKYTIMPEFFELAVKYLNEYHDVEVEKQQAVFENQAKAIEDTENEVRGLQRMLYQGRCNEDFFDEESKKLEQKLVMLRKQFNEQEEQNKDWRKETLRFFNFARYAKQDFESDSDDKKRSVLADLGQNLKLLDGQLLFEPIKYLIPVMESRETLEAQLAEIGTQPQQMKKASFEALISNWYPGQDSNLRP